MTQRILSLVTPNNSHSGPLKKRGKVSTSKILPLWRYGRWNIFLEFDSELFWNIKGYQVYGPTMIGLIKSKIYPLNGHILYMTEKSILQYTILLVIRVIGHHDGLSLAKYLGTR